MQKYSQQIHRVRVWNDAISDTPEELRTACPNTEPFLHYDSTIVDHRDTSNYVSKGINTCTGETVYTKLLL